MQLQLASLSCLSEYVFRVLHSVFCVFCSLTPGKKGDGNQHKGTFLALNYYSMGSHSTIL